jgi:hypothetical protein
MTRLRRASVAIVAGAYLLAIHVSLIVRGAWEMARGEGRR